MRLLDEFGRPVAPSKPSVIERITELQLAMMVPEIVRAIERDDDLYQRLAGSGLVDEHGRAIESTPLMVSTRAMRTKL